MHVAYLSSTLTVHDERFLRKLVERGHRTSLITYYPGAVPSRIRDIPELEILHQRPRALARWQSALFGLKGRPLRRLLRELRPDVLHSGYVWKDGFAAALSGFRPHLVMPWGSDILVEPDRFRVLRWIVRFVLRRADMITCDCEVVADKIGTLSGFPRERIVIFPWGVDRSVFHRPVRPSPVRRDLGWGENIVLIMNRSFEPIYNVTGFLEALGAIVRVCPDVRVLLGGSGSQEALLREAVRRGGLEHVVHFFGHVPPERMAEYLGAADLYVSNSLSDGTSLSLLEAMACGLPVVVTDVPANLEWIQPGVNGFVARRGDPTHLAEVLIAALGDSGRLARMGERNRAIAEQRADWEKNFDRLEQMYSLLLKERQLAYGGPVIR